MSTATARATAALPFTPDWLQWADQGTRVVAARIGSTEQPVVVELTGAQWTAAASDLVGGKVTAVAVTPVRSLLAIAEQIPLDTDPNFQRIRLIDIKTTRQLWARNYVGADSLLISDHGDGLLIGATWPKLSVRGLATSGAELEWSPVTVPDGSQPWSLSPEGGGSYLVLGSPPTLLSFPDEEFAEWPSPNPGLPDPCSVIRYAATGVVVVMGGSHRSEVPPGGSTAHVLSRSFVAVLRQETGAVEAIVKGEADTSLLGGGGWWLHDAAVSVDGRIVATATESELTIRGLPDLEPIARPTPIPPPALRFDRRMRCHPDGTLVAVNWTRDGRGVMLIETTSGQCVWQQSGEVTGFEFSPDGSSLAVSDAGRLRIYDVGTLTAENWGETQQWPVDGNVDVVSASTVPLDEQFDSTVVIGGGRGASGGGVEFHQVVGGGPTTLSQPATPVVGVTFGPDQELYAVWRRAGVKPLRARRRTGAVRTDWDTPPPSGVAFVAPGSVVVVTGRNVVRRSDVSSALPEAEKQLASAVQHVVLAGSSGMVAVAGGSRTWLLDTETLEPRWFTDHVGDVSALTVDPVGAVIVAHGDGVTVIQADQLDATGPLAPLPTTALKQLSPGVAVDNAVASTDRSLLAVTAGNSVGILDGATGATRFTWQFDYPVVKVVFNPRDAVVVIATQEPLLVMRDVIDGDEFWWTRPPVAIQDIAFSERTSPGMEPLLFVAGDGGVRMYERLRRG